jgi:hypothetical protein
MTRSSGVVGHTIISTTTPLATFYCFDLSATPNNAVTSTELGSTAGGATPAVAGTDAMGTTPCPAGTDAAIKSGDPTHPGSFFALFN